MVVKRKKRVEKMQRQAQALPNYVWRRRFVLGMFVVAAAGLTWRAVDQQIFEKDFLQSEAADRHLSVVKIPAHRGVITDRKGSILAMSTPVDSIGVNPRVLRADSRKLKPLAEVLGIDIENLRQRLARYSHKRFIFLKRRLPPEMASKVMAVVAKNEIKGVRLEREYRRYYPGGEVFSHLIGFTDIDDHGQEGLELAYDQALSGQPGKKRVLRDGRRQAVADVESIKMPSPGDNLALGLDQRIQYIAYRELKKAIRDYDAKAGSAVILDVRSGEVVAMVNQPGYNSNGSRSNSGGRLRNRAITDVYEPGSTMKPFTVAAALELGTIQPNETIDTAPGYFYVGSSRVRDHRDLGVIDLTTLIRRSSNVGAGKIALDMPSDDYRQQLANLGFGVTAGTGFPGEASGRLTAASGWARIDQATLSFGYGISVSTLQLAQAYAVLAADGIKRPVSLLRVDEPVQGKRVMAAETARALRLMMETVVSPQGTAPAAAIPGYRVAGKTGTVKKFGENGYSSRRYLSLFAGMAPVENPRLVMVVMIDEPQGKKYYGGLVAAPIFSAVLDDALRLMNVPPDNMPQLDTKLAIAKVAP